ncbi:MAG: ATP:cob(I)alamin adenosyltransferase [Candidatus Hydrogenedentes bacterium]|jgi:cob(I)alamin adenosyltransferase|nr:ATP:cob(I)alamin adenosyltransferase [Candidatus Hydrogenedentota bacterium]
MSGGASRKPPDRSQVTTKRGDRGKTVAISGVTYSKSHVIMDVCGAVDSLRAHTAMARLLALESGAPDAAGHGAFLLWLMHVYFLIGSECSDPLNKHPEHRKQDVSAKHLEKLEAAQTELESRTRLPKRFVVGASNRVAAQLDIASTQARALERDVVRLMEAAPEFTADSILPFVNRLSDFLFMLARTIEDGQHITVDYGLLDE